MILAGDIGGTKAELAQFSREGRSVGQPSHEESLLCSAYPSFDALLEDYLARHPARFSAACLGVAGPVVDGTVRITHLMWDIEARSVAARLALTRVLLINDLVANGYGIEALSSEQLEEIHPGTPDPSGNVGLVSAGTGLGESILVRIGEGFLPVPSESGHADFAPRTDDDLRVFRAFRARYGRVSWERILSGPGIAALGAFFHEECGAHEDWKRHLDASGTDGTAEIVTRLAMENACAPCASALGLFVSAYGAEAGNMALRGLTRGGVYLGGGIAPKVLPALRGGRFVDAFRNKEHLRPLLTQIPVWVIREARTALFGAARYAAAAG